MSAIRCVYLEKPQFPAVDQHPDAVRYQVGAYFVDAVGGEPTLDQVEEVLGLRGNSKILAQLAEIDQLTLKGVRGLREFIIAQAQLTDYLITNGATPIPGEPVSDNIGIKNIRDLEAAAVALRAQLVK